MSNKWPLVALDDILTKSEELIEIQSDKTYRQVTVRLWGNGLALRGEVDGTQIATTKQNVIHPQQFLISRIDARNGASGIVPDFLDGAIVTNDFPVFNVDHSRLLPEFLGWMSRTQSFVELCKAASEGTTNRVRLKLGRFLATKIPLPPLDEQRRIVTRIETLAAKVEQAQRLRQRSVGEVKMLIINAKAGIFNGKSSKNWYAKALSEVAPINMGQSPPGISYNQLGDGVPLLNGPTEFGTRHPVEVQWTTDPTKLCKPGDILLCVRGNTTGRMNWADKEYCIGRGLAALTVNTNICLPEYIYHFVETQTQQMLALTAGSTFPNLPGSKLGGLKIPVPLLSEQRRIVAYLDNLQAKVEAAKRHQAATAGRLESLLPSILDRAFRGEL